MLTYYATLRCSKCTIPLIALIAPHCTTLHKLHTTLHHITPHYTTLHKSTQYYTALHYTTPISVHYTNYTTTTTTSATATTTTTPSILQLQIQLNYATSHNTTLVTLLYPTTTTANHPIQLCTTTLLHTTLD